MTVKLQNYNNQLNYNSNDEDDNDEQPGFCARATLPFDQFVTAIDTTSNHDLNYSDSQVPLSVEDDQSSEIHASGDEEIFNEGQSPHFRRYDELANDSDIDFVTPNGYQEVPRPQNKNNDIKLSPHPLQSEKQSKNAAVKLVEAQIHQKAKNYEVLDPDLDEDHIRALRQKSRQDLTPFVFTVPPRIAVGERNPQVGNILRNLIAAQRTNFVAIQSQFLIGKEVVTQRMLEILELIGQAIADAQQIRKQNLSYRNSNFSYCHPPASVALSPRDKILIKEDRSISQHFRQKQRDIIRSFNFLRGRNSYRRGGARRANSIKLAQDTVNKIPQHLEASVLRAANLGYNS
ncbi:MAG: hypothetical protein EZS28_002873 [Streblomastix strix]|uniref:Uncharacterized protein n=1 Tax=Streblomastix strix TaxID=222440 RepID=A0A5J4X307_9EUKA|nr:MAG: hypothetical protein EZS28_002873 [Streblomastix strix]